MTTLKLIISTIIIVLITETARKNAPLAGIIAGLPINILISMFWIYFDKKDLADLANFSNHAIIGVFSTLVFLFITAYFFKKQAGFFPTIIIGIAFLTIFLLIKTKIPTQI